MSYRGRTRGPVAIACLLMSIPAFLAIAMMAHGEPSGPPAIAVVDFDFLDTSGEAGEEAAEHDAQLALFRAAVESELEGKLEVLRLPCSANGCRPSNTEPELLVTQAREAGAEFLVFGSVHKVSTLIQNLQVEALDLETEKVVLRRQISFRGDSDQAYERAGRSVGRTIVDELALVE
jgi:hypothetical protein